MKLYEKPEISAIAEMKSEQVFAKQSGNSNNGRWGSGNQNSNNNGVDHGTWQGGGNNNQDKPGNNNG